MDGRTLNLTDALLPLLKDISRILANVRLSDVLALPEHEIVAARDDVRNAMHIATAVYGATEWIFGREALGTRFIAWISKNADADYKAMLIVSFALLRRYSKDILDTQEIETLANQAERLHFDALHIKILHESDARFNEVFPPKRMRRALKDRRELDKLLTNIRKAALSNVERRKNAGCDPKSGSR